MLNINWHTININLAMLKLKYQETIHLIYNFIISKAFVLSAENGTDQKNEAYFT